MSLHPYLVLKMEVAAVKKWLYDLNRSNPVNDTVSLDTLFNNFKQLYCNDPTWIYFDSFPDIRPTKSEKIIYLHSLGLSVHKIKDRLSASPNYILKMVKTNENKRHFQPHGIEDLLPVWENTRKNLPDEIFIKYL